MGDSPDFKSSELYERLAHAVLAGVGIVSVVALVFLPSYRQLVGYGLYAIPAHLLISLLPNEPGLLYVAKSYHPALVATVGTVATMVAGVLDFWLIGWFVNHGLVKDKLYKSRIYLFAHRIFTKAPFILIAASALLPVPFYPVKILAIAGAYPLRMFLIAVLIGRWPRFYLLAIGGRAFQAPNSWLLGAAIVLEVLAILGIWRTRRSTAGATRDGSLT